MEDDIDIYADLPSIIPDKNDQSCNCEDLKKELDSLKSALENIQKAKENLENNLFSLLKTAKAEIVRKDNMIDDLRKRLDDATFRRNNKGESQSFSAYKLSHRMSTIAETYESVSSTYSYENETGELNQTELHCGKYKRIKSEKSVDQISTVFGERLHKRIMKDEQEEKKVASLKLNPEINTRGTLKENIVESNKENGSRLNINNDNESNIAMKNSSSEISYRNNSGRRRMSEDNDMHENKRIKIEDNKNVTGKSDYNFITQYDLKDSFVQNEIKDNPVKLEDRLDAVHSFKKERDSFDARYRAISEHKDVKQDQYCTNGWRKRRSNSRDRDDRRRKSIDRYSWTTSVSERPNSDYKESNYRYNSRRSYSSSRSNQESSSSHHLRIRSSNTYRDRKYDDCKSDRRYRSERSKRDYDSRGDSETKRRSREHSNLRDTSRYVSSNIEDGESGNLYKNSKYEKDKIRRTKETEANVSDNKRSHDSVAIETDFQTSSSRTVVSTVVNSDKKDETKSKSDIKSTNSIESASINDLSNLEEGEILDSPEKTNNFEDLSNENKIREEKSIKMLPIEDKNEQLNSENNDKVVNETRNCNNDINICESHLYYHQNLADSIVDIVETIEEVHDDNIDNDCCYMGEKLKNSIIKTVNNMKEVLNDINSVNDIQITKTDDLSIKDATKKEEINKPSNKNATKVSEDSNFVTDSVTCKIDEELSSTKITIKVETVFNCDIESRDESQISTKSDTFLERSDKCNTGASHLCLSDHNYNQNPPVNANDFDADEKLPVIPGCRKIVSATAKTTEVQLEEPVNVQSIDVKRTTSSLKNKKDQDKGIVISRRRKAVKLSDSNASMTVLMNTGMKTSPITDNCNDNDSVLKPRACRTSRIYKSGL